MSYKSSSPYNVIFRIFFFLIIGKYRIFIFILQYKSIHEKNDFAEMSKNLVRDIDLKIILLDQRNHIKFKR